MLACVTSGFVTPGVIRGFGYRSGGPAFVAMTGVVAWFVVGTCLTWVAQPINHNIAIVGRYNRFTIWTRPVRGVRAFASDLVLPSCPSLRTLTTHSGSA